MAAAHSGKREGVKKRGRERERERERETGWGTSSRTKGWDVPSNGASVDLLSSSEWTGGSQESLTTTALPFHLP